MRKSDVLMPPLHPGEILREDFMEPLGLAINKLALDLYVPATRIGEIVHERRRITAGSAGGLRLVARNGNLTFCLGASPCAFKTRSR
jgi:addiction module HigA family antidote